MLALTDGSTQDLPVYIDRLRSCFSNMPPINTRLKTVKSAVPLGPYAGLYCVFQHTCKLLIIRRKDIVSVNRVDKAFSETHSLPLALHHHKHLHYHYIQHSSQCNTSIFCLLCNMQWQNSKNCRRLFTFDQSAYFLKPAVLLKLYI